ncbi:hypothetical protein HPB50_006909 [Hyalomma asiaticum]|uniref:Uncharacterized protein n=1 Tax=Hyalomma asiaticum TaxID=266040 RepID=A0ACB7RHP4_HYAAI|nr:hypothetical protein HPB50_006909 [Hyalomma asiaticum]
MPFFAGVVRAKCMRNPLYDMVLGNIESALTADQGASRKPQQHEAGHADKGVKGADGTPPASGRTVVEDGQGSLENGARNVQAPKDPSLLPSLTENRVEFQAMYSAVQRIRPCLTASLVLNWGEVW